MLSHTKNELMPCAATGMDLEMITLSDVSQTETNITPHDIKYCSGLPFPPPGHLPDPGIKLGSSALQADSLPFETPGKP